MKLVTVIALIFCILTVVLQSVQAVPKLERAFTGGAFYIEIDQKYNWFEASHECARNGRKLVEVPHAKKNEELLNALKSYVGNPKNFWMGANDEYNRAKDLNRAFYWSSNGGRVTFTNWLKGEPNNVAGNEHCLQIFSDVDGFKWNDKDCTVKMGFICE
ncbi:lectin subunit alpha-like [Musca autumnalis]|uniref:lectin subunit alpha-like n=1 Tax=Musca autumnalis TaxID=221902 RepID=UPI003CE7D7C0